MNGRDEVKPQAMPGEKLGREKNARELTAEIEAVTNAELAGRQIGRAGLDSALTAPGETLPGGEGTTMNQAGRMGSEALTSQNPDQRFLGRGIISSMPEGVPNGAPVEAIRRETEDRAAVEAMAERDNGYAREYEPGVSTVGEASSLEQRERAEADQENLRNEIDPKRDNEARIMARSQEERGKLAARWVGDLLGRKSFVVSELINDYRKEQDMMLQDFEVPRTLGDRN